MLVSSPPTTGRPRRGGRRIAALAVFLGVCLVTPAAAVEQVPVEFGTNMLYLDNSASPGIGMSWINTSFDDSGWLAGQYGVGYDNGSGALDLLLTTVPNTTRSVYTRVNFNVADVTQVQNLFLGCDYDDGCAAWINGVEVYRSNSMPGGTLDWDSSASDHESSNGTVPVYEYEDISGVGIPALQNGNNVLAIGGWNIGLGSSDLVLVPHLILNKDVTLTRAPYLQIGTHDSIVVRWQTDVPTDSRVHCGTTQGVLSLCGQNTSLATEHDVILTGLGADTQYYYSVGSSTQVLAGDDPNHFFVTSPLPGTAKPTRIWVLGDAGTGNADQAAVRDAYYGFTGATHTDLWLMLGDNAYNTGTQTEYQNHLFDVYPDMLIKSVLWPTIGNHDAIGPTPWAYFQVFNLPSAGEAGGVASGYENFYSFDYGNVHFIVLDSETVSRSPSGAMLTWLALDLAATTADWVIAYWHHPPYSKGVHDSDLELPLQQMRENALPILENYGVDLTLTGHSHNYERSFLIDGHYGASSTFGPGVTVDGGDGKIPGDGAYAKPLLGPDPHSGAVHVVAGNAGKITGGALNHPAMYLSLNVLGSLVLDVNGPRLDLTFIDDNGVVRDGFTMVKAGSGVPPVADYQATPSSGTMPLSVDFTDQSQNGPQQWAWDFDNDGSTDSMLANPSHQYAQQGLYSVKLGVTNLVGNDEVIRTDDICVHAGPPPRVDDVLFAADDQTFDWPAGPSSAAYDVVKGDLGLLRANGGDFMLAQAVCLENDSLDAQAIDPANPTVSGQAFFYLVRRVDCATEIGTYQSGGPGQTGSRDAGLSVPCQ